jgi:hypothetical protein
MADYRLIQDIQKELEPQTLKPATVCNDRPVKL